MCSKFSIFLFIGFYISVVLCEADKEKGYETKYDNIDLDEILKNDRLRKNYVKCLVNDGPCTPDGQELKSNKHINKRELCEQKSKRKSKPKNHKSLHKYFNRLATRRNRNQLFKMYAKAEGRFNQSDPLSHR